jgi:hypothetical protein
MMEKKDTGTWIMDEQIPQMAENGSTAKSLWA